MTDCVHDLRLLQTTAVERSNREICPHMSLFSSSGSIATVWNSSTTVLVLFVCISGVTVAEFAVMFSDGGAGELARGLLDR